MGLPPRNAQNGAKKQGELRLCMQLYAENPSLIFPSFKKDYNPFATEAVL